MICQPTRVFHLTSIHLKWVYDRRKLAFSFCTLYVHFSLHADVLPFLRMQQSCWAHTVFSDVYGSFFFQLCGFKLLFILIFLNDTVYHIWWNCQILCNLLFCCSLHTHSFPTYFFFTSDLFQTLGSLFLFGICSWH